MNREPPAAEGERLDRTGGSPYHIPCARRRADRSVWSD